MKGKKRWAAELIFFVLVIAATAYGLFHGNDLGQVLRLVGSAQWGWWILGLVLVVLFICGESLILHDMMKVLGTRHKGSHCVLYSFIGFFFSAITPSAGGGQPAQVVCMKKDGIPGAVSVPVLMLVTITYKLVLVIYGFGVFLLRPRGIMTALEPVMGWCILGFCLNVAFITLYLLLMLRPGVILRSLDGGFWIVRRFVAQERIDGWKERAQAWIDRYGAAADCLRRQGRMLVRVTVLSVLQRTLLFAVTYAALRSFGLGAGEGVRAVVLQAMISMSTDLLPLPGGMGASETMFMRIFPPLCGQKLLLPVLLVSRGISYYGQLLLSAAVTAMAPWLFGRAKGEKREDDRIL